MRSTSGRDDWEDWDAVEALVTAVGAGPRGLAAAVGEVGFARASAVAVREIPVRWDPPQQAVPAAVHLRIRYDGQLADYEVTARGERTEVIPGRPSRTAVTVTYDLGELLRSLFGPRDGLRPAPPQVEIDWPETSDISALAKEMGPSVQGVEALLAACSATECDLGRWAVAAGSDKWGGVHWYTRHYDRYFRALRDEPVRVLEIGVGGYADESFGGGSLLMWQRYFRRGLVYGLDLYRKPQTLGPRVRTVRGDQSDPEFLAALAAELGPFDVVIDDGSHVNGHVRTSFEALFPHVREGGLYVVEDIQTSYWPGYGGSPLGTQDAATSLGLMASLVDLLHHREYRSGSPAELPPAAHHVTGVHFHHNVAFVEKGANHEQPSPGWIPREAFPA
ncbi:class I SAM-dependent methyltransferase [Streptomyces coacervatus]|uniref:Class I SAM-dependent methyltransferase n=1 Tax=Streptomyces coacervatus TaxID=647381 RepID=A0ABP7IR87_9ACTN|nr:class I SAM-dependent methyltransferase [Streptomyces coacervatus]MDF2266828.1 class I SAM-dependent methyltransferase [Streptomyces coacervatus]